MTVAALMDHTATSYRGTEATGTYGEVTSAWAAQEAAFPCTVQVDSERVNEVGPGEMTAGVYRLYAADPTLDIAERDVIDILTGPEAGIKVKVVQVGRPRSHHLEARCETWEGEL